MSIIEVYAHTEVGSVRLTNEDHILVGRFIKNRGTIRLFLEEDDDYMQKQCLLFAIADGISSKLGGALASQLTLFTLDQHFYSISRSTTASLSATSLCQEILLNATMEANIAVLQAAQQQPELTYMGSTLSGVCLSTKGLLTFNAGDSRVYRYRSPLLTLLTTDDTVTQLAIREKRITLAEARRSDQRHCLTNYVGYKRFNCTITQESALRVRDTLLICSDGLYDLIGDEQLEQQLGEPNLPLPILGRELIQAAIAQGGHDNISLILLRLT